MQKTKIKRLRQLYNVCNKYTGNRRSGKLELQDPILGNICELTYQSI